MMRLLLFYIAFLFGSQLTLAAPRDRAAMMRIAYQALQGGAMGTRASGATGGVSIMMEKSLLTVFRSADGRIAVVTADDEFPEVIGLSDQPLSDELPDGLAWWMESVDRRMQQALGMPQRLPKAMAATLPDSVKPFVQTQWGQTAPFNTQCPTKTQNGETQHCKVGCVALAMGQIMNYYEFPQRGTGSKTYGLIQKVSADFGATTYDWDNMPDNAATQWTQAQTDAVGTLLFHCGVSVSTMYGVATSTVIRNQSIPTAMTTYFGYDAATIRYMDRADYDNSAWLDTIYQELAAARPVLYTGNSATYGGHAFVLDGYNSAGKIHVNWGWFGNGNGYYNIDLMESGVDFNQKQAMVVGIRPASSTMPVVLPVADSSEKRIVGLFDFMGRPVSSSHQGPCLIKYSDGSVVKKLSAPRSGR